MFRWSGPRNQSPGCLSGGNGLERRRSFEVLYPSARWRRGRRSTRSSETAPGHPKARRKDALQSCGGRHGRMTPAQIRQLSLLPSPAFGLSPRILGRHVLADLHVRQSTRDSLLDPNCSSSPPSPSRRPVW